MVNVRALHPTSPPARQLNRWLQVVLGAAGMMALAGILFVWPLLRAAPGAGLEETLTAAENAFAAFIIVESLFVPAEAWLGDRLPRVVLAASGASLVVVGALGSAAAASAHARVAWSVLGGAGAGLAYGATVAKALQRFTDRKALCAGVTAAACLGVLALALGAVWASTRTGALPILLALGAAQALVIVVATLFILYPVEGPPPPEW